MLESLTNKKIFIGFFVAASIYCLLINLNVGYSPFSCDNRVDSYDYHQYIDFEKFDNINGTDHFIVPNIVHLIYLGKLNFEFGQMIALYSIFLNQSPDKIYIHCDVCEFNSRFWSTLNRTKCLGERVVFKRIKNYDTIFGVKAGYIQHRGDVVRLMILMTYGGIYLDNDVYVVNSLDKYRKYEMTLGLEQIGKVIGNQVIIANQHARFLKTFYDSYRYNYTPSQWYYNGGIFPATLLKNNTNLVHLVEEKFNNEFYFVLGILYKSYYREWKNLDAIHLLTRHNDFGRTLNETSIQTFNHTYGEMCRDVLTRIKRFIK